MQYKSEQELKLKEECTFQPKRKPSSACRTARSKCTDIEKIKSERIEKLNNLKDAQKNKDLKECCFKPQMDDNSKIMVEKKGYSKGFMKPLERSDVEKHVINYTFTPCINNKEKRETPFPLRLEKQNKAPFEEQKETKKESKTRSSVDRNVFTHLFNISKVRQLKQTQRIDKEVSMAMVDANRVTTNKKSEEMHEELKFLAFQKIFELIDLDKDGLVSADSLETHKLPREVTKCISALLHAIKENDVPLTEDEFIESMFVLFDGLTLLDKKVVLEMRNKKNKKRNSVDFSFKPEICNNSRVIQKDYAKEILKSRVVKRNNSLCPLHR